MKKETLIKGNQLSEQIEILEIAEDEKQAAIQKALKEQKEKAEKEENERKDAERKAEEEAKQKAELASDLDKILAFIFELSAVKVPNLQSEAAKKIVLDAVDSIERLKFTINEKIKTIK